MSEVDNLLSAAGNPSEVTTSSVAAIVLAALKQHEAATIKRLDAVLEKVSTLDSDLRSHKVRTGAAIGELRAEHERLSAAFARLTQRSMDFNLLLHGLPEDLPALGGSMCARDTSFREAVRSELAKFDPAISDADFEKAHRLGPVPKAAPGTTARPRPIVIRFFNRYTRERLLNESIHRFKANNKKDTGLPYLTSHNYRGPGSESSSTSASSNLKSDTGGSRGAKRTGGFSHMFTGTANQLSKARRPNIVPHVSSLQASTSPAAYMEHS